MRSTRKYDDDLFKDSTMTFGEHLEELRYRLFRSLLGVGVMLILALVPPFDLAARAVTFINAPLQDALQKFYARQSERNIPRDRHELQKHGLEAPPEDVLRSAVQEGLSPKLYLYDPRQMQMGLDERFTGTADLEAASFTPSNIIDPRRLGVEVYSGRETANSPESRVWELLNNDERALVRRIAETEENAAVEAADQRLLAEAFQRIVDNPEFYREQDFVDIRDSWSLLDFLGGGYDAKRRERYESLLADAAIRPNSTEFNRYLLNAAFPEAIAAGPTRSGMLPLLLWMPIEDDYRTVVKSLNAHEMFMIYIKAAFLVAFVLASPWVFYQMWMFVGAGLYPHEKRHVYTYGPLSLVLFVSGCLVAFFFVFEPVLEFLLWFNEKMNIDPDIRISEWFGFAMLLPLGFGVSFQLPVAMLFLERIGAMTVATYLSKWRVAILLIFVIGMVLTPGDPYSMLLMAIPLTFLYFGGIGLCKWLPKGRNPFDEELAT